MGVIHGAIAVVALLVAAPAARAQALSEPVSRVDVSAALGWLSANKSGLDSEYSRNDWYNTSLYGGAGAGWYWTDHWKTEIDGGLSSPAELSVYSTSVTNGRTVSLSHYKFATRRLAIGQQYQFFRNSWIHPFVGAGLDLTWEETTRTDEIYPDPLVRTTTHSRRTELLTRPFATFGAKAYLTPHAFFRTDLKLVAREGVSEAFVRLGLGVDF
jgi:outer membrane protein W